ncbi:hypothetical protein GCM10025864_20250 [Luteimicrobium album]|uniref:Extracellular solute-binding protein n=1 Tax=Luteimicrobium album TaxID=1054550 RepID=A0ABQ6I0J3_9MICO|nr:hypothetical protein GCM10025864_20250 [Luteimicrobium album]
MRKFRTAGTAAATAAALALTVAACSSDGGSDDPGTSTKGATTIDVWLMRDSISDAFQQEFVAGFEQAHPDVKVDVQVQEWDGIGQKIISALASDDAPDVIEVGNTQVAQYAASGGLGDLTDKVSDLGGSDWIPGLAEPGKIDGKQYGIPYYAANRVVLYNKDLFAKAGITDPRRPATSGSRTPPSSTPAATRASTWPARTGTPSPASSGTRAASSRRRTAAPGRAGSTPRPRPQRSTSTGSSRSSARAPRTPTSSTRRRSTCSRAGRSRR